MVSVLRSQCPLCCAFSYNFCAVSRLQPLAPLFALFSAPVSFVFNHFQPLFPKHPGWGVSPFNPIAADPRRPKVGQPFLAVLRFQVRANSNAQTHADPKPGGLPKNLAQHASAGSLTNTQISRAPAGRRRTPQVGQPFLPARCRGAVLRRSPNNPPPQPNGGPMTSKPAPLRKPSLEYLHPALRTSNPCSPKWSIIPAPASATRLRGRSV